MEILPRHKIDTQKWDACVQKAWCESVYGYSWYLDACCNWQGLVIGNYEAVLALPVRKKYGMLYVYVPYACQKLGVYSVNKLLPDVKQNIIDAVSSNYKFLDLSLEDFGQIPNGISNRNIELALNKDHAELLKAYASNTKRNLKKAEKANVSVVEADDFDVLADVFLGHKVARGEAEILDDDLMSMRRRFEKGSEHGKMVLLFAKNADGTLLGGALFAASVTRYYFLFSGLTDEGKQCGAMFAVIDTFIKRHAGEDKILDFEGSNNAGVARFYKSFGGYESTYWHLRINRLPWPLRWLKK